MKREIQKPKPEKKPGERSVLAGLFICALAACNPGPVATPAVAAPDSGSAIETPVEPSVESTEAPARLTGATSSAGADAHLRPRSRCVGEGAAPVVGKIAREPGNLAKPTKGQSYRDTAFDRRMIGEGHLKPAKP